MVYSFDADSYIHSLTFNQSVNELPNANITLDDTSIDYNGYKFYLSFLIEKLSTSLFPSYNPIFFQGHMYDIVNRSWNGILSLSLMYARDLMFTPYVNPNSPTQTLCKQTLTSIYNYFLTLYPCFTSLFHTSTFTHSGVVFRFEPNNMSFIDFLNYLTTFGFYWFVDFMYSVSSLPVLRIFHITSVNNKGTITGGDTITIDSEHPNYKTIKLIKEPYDDNIPREIKLTGEEPCITLNFGIRPEGISVIEIYTAGWNDLGVMGFNENGTKWWHWPTAAPSIGSCTERTITDCNNQYAHKFVQAGTCAQSTCTTYGSVQYCGAYKVGGEGAGASILCGQATGSDCVKQLKMIAQGCTFDDNFPPQAYVRLAINPAYICDADNTCVVINQADYNFDKELKTHTITTSIPNTCNAAPYEITIQNINQTLWDLFVNYHTFISTRPKRIIRITNPICDVPLQVGYHYNVVLGNTTLTNCRLIRMSINANNQNWGLELELERYDT